MKDKKMYWFCLVFNGRDKNNDNVIASSYIGYDNKNITMFKIEEAKKSLDINDEAVLLNCIYLCYETKEYFLNEKFEYKEK